MPTIEAVASSAGVGTANGISNVVEAAASAGGIGAASATGRGLAGVVASSAGIGSAVGDSPRYMDCPSDMVGVSTPIAFESTILMVLNSDMTAAGTLSFLTIQDMQAVSAINAAAALAFAELQMGMDIRSAVQALTDNMVIDDGNPSVWVVNPSTGAAWRYDDYGFTQFLQTRRFSYGVRPDGIYLLGGESDAGAPIRASVDLGQRDFGTTLHKRAHTAYITTDATGGMQLRVTDDSGQSYLYAVTPTDRMNTAKVKLGRGLVANFFDLQLFNTDGGDFDLAGAELLYDVLKRRV